MSIVVITNNKNGVFQSDVITGIERVAYQNNLDVLVDSLVDAPFFYNDLPDENITGLIVIANVLPDEELERLYQLNKPMTLVSHRVPHSPLPAVIQNNADGIHKLVDYLVLECNRHNIVFINGDMNQHDGISRQQIFEQRMLHHNIFLQDHQYLRGDFIESVAAQSMQDALSQGLEFDAVIAADFMMGCAVVDVLSGSGIAVGDEVFVVGFGDGNRAIECGLTTVGTDIIALGQRAARQLIAQIHGTPIQGVTWLNTQLIERESSHRLVKHS